MKSVSTTRPPGVRSSVRSTIVSSTYSRRDLARLDGAQPPGTAGLTQDAGEDTQAESNDGRHAQSIDPSRETSAEPWQFDSRA